MDFKTILFDQRDDTGIITLNRPEVLNALNKAFFNDLNAILDEVPGMSIKSLIITGQGKAFAAGADIAEMAGMNQSDAYDFSKRGQAIFNRLEDLDIPVLAAVNGYALGGGCELAMACHIRIAGKSARFGQPEVSLGLIPGFAGTQRLVRHIGLSNALYYLLTADQIYAEDAFRMGLVQKICEDEELMDTALDISKKISSKGPQAVVKAKKAAVEGSMTDFDTGAEVESIEFKNLFGNEGTEGMKAFLEKRKPNW
ncbi:MAG: enoyl-CoA hydratase/isomerase family protein [Deltaproteobacteria bacterium]|nr:enoyl-CoA hydratase/isomerase family protein [Deltaproteobacteria bacterium]